MELKPTPLEGCFELKPLTQIDNRGSFTKTFHINDFEDLTLNTSWVEEYFTFSKKNVLRGMPLQLPPSDHFKMVYCLEGEVLDVVLDLRSSSSTYGKSHSLNLSSQNKIGLYIPPGIAHGFLSLTQNSLLTYKVSSVYSPEHDSGVAWNSFEFNWPIKEPTISDRDQKLEELQNFNTPF